MTVEELIATLEQFPKDAEVHYAYDYGDHWRTQVAPKVTGAFEGSVIHSSYHRMDKLAELTEDEMDSDARTVVVLE